MAKQSKSGSRPRRNARPRKQKKKQLSLQRLEKLWSPPEFRQDTPSGGLLKVLRFTQLQRLQTLRWALYIAMCILCLVIQDVIMSRITILDTTTDLTAGILLLITVLEGSDVGSVFILISSTIYYFSGSSPGPYAVGLLTVLGIAATLFRQSYWHRSAGSIILCASLALVGYEIGVYSIGLFLGLTRWNRILAFLLTGILTSGVLIPLYHVLYRIGLIGGNVWKE